MKATNFAEMLRALSEVPTISNKCQMLEELSVIFSAFADSTVNTALKKLARTPRMSSGGARCAEVAPLLRPLRSILAAAGKTAAEREIGNVEAFLEDRGATDIAALGMAPRAITKASSTRAATRAAGVRNEIVDDYVRRLNEAAGDEVKFPTIYLTLSQDTKLSASELNAIARKFAVVSVKSRAEALRKILSWHQQFVIANAKARATAGRTAA